jgi:hypothetical protein
MHEIRKVKRHPLPLGSKVRLMNGVKEAIDQLSKKPNMPKMPNISKMSKNPDNNSI